jgi:acyl carrier protein
MLELDMDLETDLGIDSIKRVEILSGLQDEVGELPKVDPAEVTSLRTLRDVIGFIDRVRKGEVKVLDEAEFKKKLLA